jgi:hypothetical protein
MARLRHALTEMPQRAPDADIEDLLPFNCIVQKTPASWQRQRLPFVRLGSIKLPMIPLARRHTAPRQLNKQIGDMFNQQEADFRRGITSEVGFDESPKRTDS